MLKGVIVGVDRGHFPAHRTDGIDARSRPHHQGDALRGGPGVVGGAQREIDRRRWLLHDEALRHVARHAHHLEDPAPVGCGADAIIVRAGQDSGRRDRIVANLDLAAQRIRSLPELAGEFLADDDRGRRVHHVILPECAAGRQRDAGGLEVVLPHHVADHREGLVRGVARNGYPDAVAPDGDRHGFRQAGRSHRGQQLHAIQQLLQERRGLRGGIAVANRIERDQVQILRVEARLNAHRRLDAHREQSEDHQQGQRAGELSDHQNIAQAQAVAAREPDVAAFLERRGKVGACGLQSGDQAKNQPGKSGEERW